MIAELTNTLDEHKRIATVIFYCTIFLFLLFDFNPYVAELVSNMALDELVHCKFMREPKKNIYFMPREFERLQRAAFLYLITECLQRRLLLNKDPSGSNTYIEHSYHQYVEPHISLYFEH